MSLSVAQLQRVKCIDTKSKRLVYGFVRETKVRSIIPDLVIFHCLLYFYLCYEWDPEHIGKYCSVLENSVLKVTLNELKTAKAQSAFLMNTVLVSEERNKQNTQYNHWRFKLLEYKHYWAYNIIIGLWDVNSDAQIKRSLNIPWQNMNDERYGLIFSTGFYFEPGSTGWSGDPCKDNYERCKKDDILEMYLDHNMLGFKKNGQELIKRKIKYSEYKVAVYAKPKDYRVGDDQILIQILSGW